jgi:hypothetical protein
MKPIRNKQDLEITDGKIPGQERVWESQLKSDVLSDGGSVDTLSTHKSYACDCGCFQPPAGRCELCKSLSCVSCHGHCQRCNAPICRECSVFVGLPGGKAARYCQRCYSEIKRQTRITVVTRFLLSPFVKFGSQSDEQK